MKFKLKALIRTRFVSLFVSLFVANMANANLLVNGSFEDGNWNGNNGAYKTLGNGGVSLTGWEIDGSGIDWHNGAHFQTILFGAKAVDLNLNDSSHSGSISQSFTTAIADWYDVSFFASGPGNFGTRAVNVNIAGSDHNFSILASDNTNLAWQQFVFSFQATNVLTTIQFSNPNQSGWFWGAVLDNVSVEQHVPEPSTLFLFGLGLIGITARRFKKHC